MSKRKREELAFIEMYQAVGASARAFKLGADPLSTSLKIVMKDFRKLRTPLANRAFTVFAIDGGTVFIKQNIAGSGRGQLIEHILPQGASVPDLGSLGEARPSYQFLSHQLAHAGLLSKGNTSVDYEESDFLPEMHAMREHDAELALSDDHSELDYRNSDDENIELDDWPEGLASGVIEN